MRYVFYTIVVIFSVFLTSCNDNNNKIPPEDPLITAAPETINFTALGGTSTVNVTMNGDFWVVYSNKDWCTVSKGYSSSANDQLTVTVAFNPVKTSRTAELRFIMDEKDTVYVEVLQEELKDLYPDYSSRIAPDQTGMPSTALVLAPKMFAGWNLGNSLEAPGGETGWGNPAITQRLIDSIKAAGINAIRLPCAWDSHIENTTTCKLSSSWLARVKEVVDYCYNNDMYVILNIHWDGGWLENNPTYAKQFSVNSKQKALWEQIAVNFRDYDEHLLFAGTNEVHSSTNPTTENHTVQQSFNQTFVNAVRSTGGRNSYRNLVIQAYNTNIDQAVTSLVVSNDSVPDRLMVEVHYYDPWDFCGLEADADWGTVKTLWGTDYAQYGQISSWGQEPWVLTQFQKMKTHFVDEGYPVILGEYGATRRSSLTGSALEHHLASRAHYYQYVTQQAKNYGLIPFVWDNGGTGNLACGIFYRSTGYVFDSQVFDAFIAGASAGLYPY
jgi:endoglucanase